MKINKIKVLDFNEIQYVTKLRSDNTWENVELPRLMGNSNVTKITIIDPKTGIETVIFER